MQIFVNIQKERIKMQTKHMFVDTDSIFFKVAYKSKNQSELRKNYNSFCNKMKLEVSDKMINPFTEELNVLYFQKLIQVYLHFEVSHQVYLI